jgi:hypothetical protein
MQMDRPFSFMIGPSLTALSDVAMPQSLRVSLPALKGLALARRYLI